MFNKSTHTNLSRKPMMWVFLFCVAVTGIIAGCEEPFKPLEDNDKYFFSVFGYLDASADTQWIRIMPVRETVNYSYDSIGAVVTLRDLDTGIESRMTDSLFSINVFAALDDALVWNFYTTMDVVPDHSYELIIEREDGAVTRTEVAIPPDFPDPVVDGRYVLIQGADNIAEVRLDWTVIDQRYGDTLTIPVMHTQDVQYRGTGKGYQVRIAPNTDFVNVILRRLDSIQPWVEIVNVDAVIISAGDDWVDFDEIGRDVAAIPGEVSNIENGIGYLVGTVIKTVTYPVCVGDMNEIIECDPDAGN